MIVVIFIFWVIAIHVGADGCLTARVGSQPALRPIRTLAVTEHPHTYPCHMWILGLGSNIPILLQYNQNIVTGEIQLLEDEFWLDNKRSVDSADVTTIWIVIEKTWTYLLRPELDPGLLFVHQIGFSGKLQPRLFISSHNLDRDQLLPTRRCFGIVQIYFTWSFS